MTTSVSPAVIEVLERSRMDGYQLFLPEQLDRKLYEAVNRVIVLAGGKWTSGKVKAHVFPGPAYDAMEAILLTGEVTDAQREFDAFYTPLDVVLTLIALAAVKEGMSVLEPSSGEGAIALALAHCGVTVESLEIRDVKPWWNGHGEILHRQIDFMSIDQRPAFDRVVMNPPFSQQRDMLHVMHAFGFLRPGGRLVSVMSPAFTFRTSRIAQEFRSLYERANGETYVLPQGSFKSSGTMVNAVVISLTAER